MGGRELVVTTTIWEMRAENAAIHFSSLDGRGEKEDVDKHRDSEAAGVLGGAAVEFARMAGPALRELRFTAPHVSAAMVRPLEQAGWVALVLGVALLSWIVSRRGRGRCRCS